MTEPARKGTPKWVWGSGALLLLGLPLQLWGLARASALLPALVDLLVGAFGWGVGLEGVLAIAMTRGGVAEAVRTTLGAGATGGPDAVAYQLFIAGVLLWGLGWVGIALGSRLQSGPDVPQSAAVGAPLHPRLLHYRDFYWSTLAAYGGGIVLAELAVVLLQTLLASDLSTGAEPRGGMAPTHAFAVALCVGLVLAFGGGFLGAARARRLSVPEATVAILYFGLPLPILLTAMHRAPALSASLGYRLREVVYVATLLGERPELGYWLVFVGLVLALFLGLTAGFVATASGRVDVHTGFELFVATRHVSVFRPGLLFGTFAVLIFGILPPLVVYAVLHAAEAAVERTRIRNLGRVDPLRASEALHRLKSRAQSPTGMMTALSVGGVGVGVMSLIIVLSVMSGFETDLQKKILGTNAHGVVLKYADALPEYREVMEQVREVRGIVGVTPFILNEVMVSSEGNISGVMIKGIDPATVGSVTDLPEYMLPGGSLDGLEKPETIVRDLPHLGGAPDERPAVQDDFIIQTPPSGGESKVVLPGLLMGRELATSMRVVVGDRVNVVSPLGGELGPSGPMPKSRPFRVAGIFYSGMYEYDSKFVYIHLDEAKSFFNLKGASGIEFKVADIDDARRVAKSVYERLDGYPYYTKDWGEMNRNLFSALRLEKLVMAIILSIIVIVAAGLIVATVIMLVLEKRKEISVLKALGVSDGGVVKIFLAEGLQIGIAGGVLGLLAGLGWCLFIERVGIKLDPEVYYIPSLPVRIEPVQTALSVVIAVLVTFLASIYPALKAAQVEPVEGLKAE